MEFTFETFYNTKTMSVMARALRKTVRKKHSRRSHIFGWIVMLLSLLLVIHEFTLDLRTVITLIAVLAILFALLFEDWLNGYIAKRRLLPGMEKAVTVFTQQGHVTTTEIGKTEWNYSNIRIVAETARFFVFIFSANHAQLYDKRHLQGGTPEDFRQFITAMTGLEIQNIK